MELSTIPILEGYDGRSQRMVASFAWQLDDQLGRMKRDIEGLTIPQLEWQPRPGINTIGMLLAHLAIAEAYWIQVAPKEIPAETQGDEMVLKLLGIRGDADGMPLPESGGHPATLAGKSLDEYLRILDICRAATHDVLRTWNDETLDSTYRLERYRISRSRTLYHILEHIIIHRGQILMLKHFMRDQGMIKK